MISSNESVHASLRMRSLFTKGAICASIGLMTAKQPDFTDINALAMEACDLWQEHLSNLANDPNARNELMRFLEPQRRLFADWASMMRQGGVHEQGPARDEPTASGQPQASAPAAASGPEEASGGDEPASEAPSTAPGSSALGDDPLRVAQLALRVAELEKRVAVLELQALSAARGS